MMSVQARSWGQSERQAMQSAWDASSGNLLLTYICIVCVPLEMQVSPTDIFIYALSAARRANSARVLRK